MRLPRNFRQLKPEEIYEAMKVFRFTVGVYADIYLSDGLGSGDVPFAVPSKVTLPMGLEINLPGKYTLFMGDRFWQTLTSGYDAAVLIHELTHVWQYEHGYPVIANSILNRHQKGEDMYKYDKTKYKAWLDYNVEQQAQIVEDWYYLGNMKPYDAATATGDVRHFYIEHVILGGRHNTGAPMQIPDYTLDVTRPDLPYRGQNDDPFAALMAPRYPSGHPGSIERVKALEQMFRLMANPKKLLARIDARRPGDKAVEAFHTILHEATIVRLLQILRDRPVPVHDPW